VTTRAEVAQRLNAVVTEALYVAAAERRVGAPGVIPALNQAEGDLIRRCRLLVAAVDDLEPESLPREWRPREDRKGTAA
jgi:hypothetical protein